MSEKPDKKLFWACFIALVATSFVFGVRSTLIGQLGEEFNLSQTQMGQILGVGLWPFAISIIVFSLIIDTIGYKTTAYFAVACHIGAIVLTLFAKNYEGLYWGTFLVAIANGTVESFINPVTATIFRKDKSKWLNILHAGWPMGLALGAIFTILLEYAGMSWQFQFGVCLIPVVIYGLLIIPRNFPQNERVAAGVSYREMLAEVGAIGFFIMAWMLVIAVGQILNQSLDWYIPVGIATLVAIGAGVYTRGLGNWMFLLILLTIGPLATTELGTDGWMQELLKADLPHLAGWIFVMVSIIMTILRFYAGPIVHRFSPIGLLVISAALAIVGLLFLWKAAGYALIAAAIVYAFGKTFLWSTTLGLVSEQFPKGGALTLNGVSAVGVLGLGIIGLPLMGYFLDKGIDRDLQANQPAIYEKVNGEPKDTMFGKLPSLDTESVAALPETDNLQLTAVINQNKKSAFARQAALPAFMLLCYIVLFLYFKSKGGYKPVEI